MKNLRTFFIENFEARLSQDRDEPRLEEIFTSKNGFPVCEEDFFLSLPENIWKEAWSKVHEFFSPLSQKIFRQNDGIFIETEEGHSLIISASVYGKEEFRVTVNVW